MASIIHMRIDRAHHAGFHGGALHIPKMAMPRNDRAEKRSLGFADNICSVCISAELLQAGTRLICQNCGTSFQN